MVVLGLIAWWWSSRSVRWSCSVTTPWPWLLPEWPVPPASVTADRTPVNAGSTGWRRQCAVTRAWSADPHCEEWGRTRWYWWRGMIWASDLRVTRGRTSAGSFGAWRRNPESV